MASCCTVDPPGQSSIAIGSIAIGGAHIARRASTRFCFRTSLFRSPERTDTRQRVGRSSRHVAKDAMQKQTKALHHPWIRSAAARKLPLAMPQARDAPTDTLRPRKLLSAERRPLDSLSCHEAPKEQILEKSRAAANQCVWPVEPAQNWAGQSTHAYSSLRIGRCQGSCAGGDGKIRTFSRAAAGRGVDSGTCTPRARPSSSRPPLANLGQRAAP